jgi:UbiD family decarboxylase
MSYPDMRGYLMALEQHGLLRRIPQRVERARDIGCLVKWMYQALPSEKRFGLRFDQVAGATMPVVTSALGANTASVALALQCEPDAINATLGAALRQQIKPAVVTAAPCQEVELAGDDADLGRLPIVTWTPGKDGAPYLTTIVVTRDHDTGRQNMGVYRTMARDRRSVVINLAPGRQGFRNVKTWTDKGKTAPIAWVIGAPPAVHLATVANLPYGHDEIELAGALMGAPVEVVRCRTHDLLVPARAEIIIEGEIRPAELDDEGPFGEFAGFMGLVERRPVARINTITHREDPVFYGLSSQMPPSESTTIQSLVNAGVLLHTLRERLGEQAVSDFHIDQTYGGLLAHGIVAMTPQHPGHAKRIGRLVADISSLKRVTVVDADVDIRDASHIDWALNARFSPRRDTTFVDDVHVPVQMDPSVRDARGQVAPGSKMILDATQKADAGAFSLPAQADMMAALPLWNEAGLPALEIPRRLALRLDRA